jgi:hypothetical protein
MSYPSPEELRRSLEAEPNQPGVLENTVDALLDNPDVPERPAKVNLRYLKREVLGTSARREDQVELRILQAYVVQVLEDLGVRPPLQRSLRVDIPPPPRFDGGRRKSQTKKFGSCVKAVRKTVKARKGSNPESAAIAICTTTLLHPRGRTIKRYRKGRLLTQKRK